MKTYYCEGTARLKNAIGVTYHFSDTVQAENEEQARIKLYDTWEHIRITKCLEKERP